MPEILEPPKRTPETDKGERAEVTYWEAVDSFIALSEGAKGKPDLEAIVKELKYHIGAHMEEKKISSRFNEWQRMTQSFDKIKTQKLEKNQQSAHTNIIADINKLFTQFLNYGLDTSWRQVISSGADLSSGEPRADVAAWATHIGEYLSKKSEGRAA